MINKCSLKRVLQVHYFCIHIGFICFQKMWDKNVTAILSLPDDHQTATKWMWMLLPHITGIKIQYQQKICDAATPTRDPTSLENLSRIMHVVQVTINCQSFCYCCFCNSSSNLWFLIDYSSGWPISIVSQRQLTHIKADDHIAAAKTSVTETPLGVAHDLVTVHSWWNDTPADMIEDYQVSQRHQRSPLSLKVSMFCKEWSPCSTLVDDGAI